MTEVERRRTWQDKLALEVAEACLAFLEDSDPDRHEIPLALRLIRRALRAKEDALDGLGQ